MAVRKFRAKKMFDGHRWMADDLVLVTTETGVVESIVPLSDAGEGIEEYEGIVAPGLVNCHCHLELSHMKGAIGERTGLVDFVYKVVTERHWPDDQVLTAIENAEQEMLRNGIVAVGDICNNLLTLSAKQKDNLAYYNFIEASGWIPEVSESRFQRAFQLYEVFAKPGPPSRCSIVPHAPYSVSMPLWQAIQPWFTGKTVSIHNQETAYEDQFFLEGTGEFRRMYELMKIDCSHHQPTGRSSLQSYFHHLLPATNILLVHNSFIKESDILYALGAAAGRGLYFCLCPNANLYIEGVLPPVQLLRDNQVNITLGTDSLASNHSLSIVAEIRTLLTHFPSLCLEEVLRWATINGAQALGISDRFGSFEAGKQPGIVLISDDLTNVRRLL